MHLTPNETDFIPVATTTAFGDGDPLDVTLQRIAEHDDIAIVELSIGARPIRDAAALLDRYRGRFEFIAHHTAPIGDGHSIRPSIDASPRHAARALLDAGITRYSGHPPPRIACDHEAFLAWAQNWWSTLAEHGIDWSVETMYRPRTRSEQSSTGGHHLATPAQVWEFCSFAADLGWHRPLLIDASHLRIGLHSGDWTSGDITELLRDGPCDELHVSMNDGRRDEHRPTSFDDDVTAWVLPHLGRFRFVVDEGRRRGDYRIPHPFGHAFVRA